jgi:hypothetical protein
LFYLRDILTHRTISFYQNKKERRSPLLLQFQIALWVIAVPVAIIPVIASASAVAMFLLRRDSFILGIASMS